MQSTTKIFILLGLFFCITVATAAPSTKEIAVDCMNYARRDVTADTNTGIILGNCLNKDNTGKFMMYMDNKEDSCCEAKSARFVGICVNYSLCEKGSDGIIQLIARHR